MAESKIPDDAMLLRDDAAFFALWVDSYVFGSITDPPDSNWLRIAVRWQSGSRHDAATSPCLQVSDAHALSAWLQRVGDGEDPHGELEFLEPNLTFWVCDDRTAPSGLHAHDALPQSEPSAPSRSTHVTIGVALRDKLHPDWPPMSESNRREKIRKTIDDPVLIKLRVRRDDATLASYALARQLRRFPPRP